MGKDGVSALSNNDPDSNYLSSNMAYNNTHYFDDQHFRDKLKSNKIYQCFI